MGDLHPTPHLQAAAGYPTMIPGVRGTRPQLLLPTGSGSAVKPKESSRAW